MATTRRVVIPYAPRRPFLPYHERTKRWAAMVCHRRAGKTVAVINDLIRAALFCQSPFPHFAYIAPFRSQAKAVAWHYAKYFAEPVTKAVHEGELVVTLINGAKLSLFGADNADALRGLGFDGVVCDEFGDWRPSVFPSVVRPALSDRQGWATFVGTPKGKNQFWDVYDAATRDEDWFSLSLPASRSGILPQGELDDARKQLTEDAYAAEYECSFEAAILGAFYGVELRQAAEQGRIASFLPEGGIPIHTAWDLGYRDDTAIWFYQVVRGEIRICDYYAVSGASLQDIAAVVAAKGYRYGRHYLPHDARAKTLASGGKSIIEQLAGLLGGLEKLAIVPDIGVQDGIQAARLVLPRCWFAAEACREGIEALRQYQREYDEDKKAFRQTPRHDWCFTGDTEVLTRYGTHQIMTLPYSGEVLTSCGWKRYVNPRVTRKDAPVVEVAFDGGYSVRCTPDHLFKTDSGWISAECLTKGTSIQSSLTPSRSISMAASTVCGRATNTIREAAKSCTAMYGAVLSGLFQAAVTSITVTLTRLTTGWAISNAYPPASICRIHGTPTSTLVSLNLPATRQQIGIDQMLGGSGIVAMPSDRSHGLSGSARTIPASIAVKSSPPSFGQEILRNIVAMPARLRHTVREALMPVRRLVIERVSKLNQTEDVWCLTVPDAEEFSLANGAVVHNCSHPADAFRMLAVAWTAEPPKEARTVEPRPLIVGPGNTVTLNDMWAVHAASEGKRERI